MKCFRRVPIVLMIVAMAPAGAATSPNFATLYRFTGAADGCSPGSSLLNVGGVFYGTTMGCDTDWGGTIFEYDPTTRTMTTLYSFGAFGTDALHPFGRLVFANGSLYGVSTGGGSDPSASSGTVFKFDLATSTDQVLYSFNSLNGIPNAGLTYHNGYAYGTSFGTSWDEMGWGTVFKLNVSTGAITFLYNFNGGAEGAGPAGDLVFVNGSLYGTTFIGGANDKGVIFKLDPNTGAETVLYDFGAGTDGAEPTMGLTYQAGTFYGGTLWGGADNAGTVFKFDPVTNTETVLYNFTGGIDGGAPEDGDLIYLNGKLYGTASQGGSAQGSSGHGTVFSIDAITGAETVLHTFTGGKGGARPLGGVAYWNHYLFGTSWGEEVSTDYGTLFEVKP